MPSFQSMQWVTSLIIAMSISTGVLAGMTWMVYRGRR